VAELVLRVVQEVGPELAPALLEQAGYRDWNLPIESGRLSLEQLRGLTRRRALSSIARDVERTLGPVWRHEAAAGARELLRTGGGAG
jgi:hypothetical protein